MTTPASGAITIGNVQTEFGGTNPAGMSEYYSGGAYVPAGTTGGNGSDGVAANTVIPTSGTIKMANFYNANATPPASNTITIGDVSYSFATGTIIDYYGTANTNPYGANPPISITVSANASVRVTLYGGGGGGGVSTSSNVGSSAGGKVSGDFTMSSASTYSVSLGYGGGGPSAGTSAVGAGGPGAGGGRGGQQTAYVSGNLPSGAGAGASALFSVASPGTGTAAQANTILAAGGGCATSATMQVWGVNPTVNGDGAGGGTYSGGSGAKGSPAFTYSSTPGTATAAGTGGKSNLNQTPGANGSAWTGGDGSSGTTWSGPGGGAGYWGGGGAGGYSSSIAGGGTGNAPSGGGAYWNTSILSNPSGALRSWPAATTAYPLAPTIGTTAGTETNGPFCGLAGYPARWTAQADATLTAYEYNWFQSPNRAAVRLRSYTTTAPTTTVPDNSLILDSVVGAMSKGLNSSFSLFYKVALVAAASAGATSITVGRVGLLFNTTSRAYMSKASDPYTLTDNWVATVAGTGAAGNATITFTGQPLTTSYSIGDFVWISMYQSATNTGAGMARSTPCISTTNRLNTFQVKLNYPGNPYVYLASDATNPASMTGNLCYINTCTGVYIPANIPFGSQIRRIVDRSTTLADGNTVGTSNATQGAHTGGYPGALRIQFL